MPRLVDQHAEKNPRESAPKLRSDYEMREEQGDWHGKKPEVVL